MSFQDSLKGKEIAHEVYDKLWPHALPNYSPGIQGHAVVPNQHMAQILNQRPMFGPSIIQHPIPFTTIGLQLGPAFGHSQHQELILHQGPVLGPLQHQIEKPVLQQGDAKTEMCKNWAETGFCKYEANCIFAHGYGELHEVSSNPLRKTKLCRSFEGEGACKYNARCQFAHGTAELRHRQI